MSVAQVLPGGNIIDLSISFGARSAGAFLVVAATAAANLWTRIHPLWCIVIGALLGLAGWV